VDEPYSFRKDSYAKKMSPGVVDLDLDLVDLYLSVARRKLELEMRIAVLLRSTDSKTLFNIEP